MKKQPPATTTAIPATGKIPPTYDLNEIAVAAFDRIHSIMQEMGTLSPSYADIMTSTASAIGRMIIADMDLDERGHISHAERGEVKNQSFNVYSTSLALAQKGLASLGLTPTSLGKIVTATKKEENPFAKFRS
jgi:phage terminase small subunit